MAKRISQIQRVLNQDIKDLEKMDRAALAKDVSILASAANKRLRRLEKQGYRTPAYIYTQKHGGDFSVKGKNANQLLEEMERAKNFLNAKTSSVRGAKRNIKEVNQMLSKMATSSKADEKRKELIKEGRFDEEVEVTPVKYEMTKEEIETYWEAIDKIREMRPSQFNDKCLLFVDQIENYVERGRTSGQIAYYIRKAIDKASEEAMKQISDLDAELARYRGGNAVGGNSLGQNNL